MCWVFQGIVIVSPITSAKSSFPRARLDHTLFSFQRAGEIFRSLSRTREMGSAICLSMRPRATIQKIGVRGMAVSNRCDQRIDRASAKQPPPERAPRPLKINAGCSLAGAVTYETPTRRSRQFLALSRIFPSSRFTRPSAEMRTICCWAAGRFRSSLGQPLRGSILAPDQPGREIPSSVATASIRRSWGAVGTRSIS